MKLDTDKERAMPCPFCGSDDIVKQHDDGRVWKQCGDCGATGPANSKYADEDDPVWETRAARSTGLSQEPVAMETVVAFREVSADGIPITDWIDGSLPANTQPLHVGATLQFAYTAPPAPVSAEILDLLNNWCILGIGMECNGPIPLNLVARTKAVLVSTHAAPAAPLSDAKEIERRGHYDDAKLRDIGAETYRACGELPFGYEIIIELENGAGSVTLCDPDGEKQCFEGSDYFANDIRNAIDAAIAAAKGAGN